MATISVWQLFILKIITLRLKTMIFQKGEGLRQRANALYHRAKAPELLMARAAGYIKYRVSNINSRARGSRLGHTKAGALA